MNYRRGGDPAAEWTAKHQMKIAELEEALKAKDHIISALQEELHAKVTNDQTAFRSRAARTAEG